MDTDHTMYQKYLQGAVGVLWLTNIGLLVAYMIEEEITVLLGLTLTFVAATGLIPASTGLIPACRKKKDKSSIFVVLHVVSGVLHVVSGVLGTACSGLLLGEAAQCGKSYSNIQLLLFAAIANGLSGVAAHFGFLTIDEQNDIYKDKSLAYNVLQREAWYLAGFVCSVISLFVMETNKADFCSDYYFVSPLVHAVAFLILGLCNEEILSFLNFLILHTAAILSMFGLMLNHLHVADWLIVIPVYAYLLLAHML